MTRNPDRGAGPEPRIEEIEAALRRAHQLRSEAAAAGAAWLAARIRGLLARLRARLAAALPRHRRPAAGVPGHGPRRPGRGPVPARHAPSAAGWFAE